MTARTRARAAVATIALALAAAGGAATAHHAHQQAADAHGAAVRYAQDAAAAGARLIEGARASAGAALAARDATLADARGKLDTVAGVLEGAPHAEPALREQLSAAAADADAAAQADAAAWSATTTQESVAALDAAATAVRDSEAAWQRAEEARKAAEAARIAACGYKCVARQTLDELPGGGSVAIQWNNPALGSHLGGVYKGDTSKMLLNASRLAGDNARTRDVVRHEWAHIAQGRVMARHGLSWGELEAKMRGAFGSNAMEKSADCVAIRFGASWTWYTKACGGAAQQAWVDALIGGRLL